MFFHLHGFYPSLLPSTQSMHPDMHRTHAETKCSSLFNKLDMTQKQDHTTSSKSVTCQTKLAVFCQFLSACWITCIEMYSVTSLTTDAQTLWHQDWIHTCKSVSVYFCNEKRELLHYIDNDSDSRSRQHHIYQLSSYQQLIYCSFCQVSSCITVHQKIIRSTVSSTHCFMKVQHYLT